jgi:nucleotide-binding universal stress UspA family protein
VKSRTTSGVVVGVDGSPASRAALQFAMREVVRRGHGLDVVTSWVFDGTYEGTLGPQSMQEARETAERIQDEVVSAVLDEVVPPAMISRSIVEGAPGPALVRAARDADLLVVGTAHKGSTRRVLLGSVSQFCVLHSPVPITVVPEPAPAAAQLQATPAAANAR